MEVLVHGDAGEQLLGQRGLVRRARGPVRRSVVGLADLALVVAGRLAPGERLTEALAIERTGASRTPVREAFPSRGFETVPVLLQP